MAAVTRLEGDAPTSRMLSALKDNGAVVLHNLIDTATIHRIANEVDPYLHAADPAMTHVNGVLQEFFAGVRNVTGLAGKSPTFVDEVLLHPSLLGVADGLLGENSASVALNVAHLMAREPGAERQWVHRDQEVWSYLPESFPDVEVSIVLALGDFSKENGATAVVPGSHRWDLGRRPEEDEIAYAEMPAGSAVLYLGSTLHAGGANTTSSRRVGVHMSYVAGWLRTEENNCLATPPSVACRLPRRAQELLGYGMHDATSVGGGFLGCVDLQDPVDLLAVGKLG